MLIQGFINYTNAAKLQCAPVTRLQVHQHHHQHIRRHVQQPSAVPPATAAVSLLV